MTVLGLAVSELRANWRRHAIQAVILLAAVGTQVLTALSSEVSTQAVQTYAVATYGYAQTWELDIDGEVSPQEVLRFDDELRDAVRQYPWAVVATAASVPGTASVADAPHSGQDAAHRLDFLDGPWDEINPAWQGSATYREAMTPPFAFAVLGSPDAFSRLGLESAGVIELAVDSPGDSGASAAGTGGGSTSSGPPHVSPRAARQGLTGVMAFPSASGPRNVFSFDLVANRMVLARLGDVRTSVHVYWRCNPDRCADVGGLVRVALRQSQIKGSVPQRVDSSDSLVPVLRQQAHQRALVSAVVLVLGTVAIVIVSLAFFEVRSPELITLRMLGATRLGVGALTVLESLLLAVAMGAVAVLLGLLVTELDPNRLNYIPSVVVQHLDPPYGVLAKALAVAVGIGVASSVLPALRSYRAVKAA